MPSDLAPDAETSREPLAVFLAEIAAREGGLDAVGIFHAVRRLPYLSTGDRSLEGVLARRAGSCSGKHILLAALLGEIGVPARVELVQGDFATPLKEARNIPAVFTEAAMRGVPDIHNVVAAAIGGRSVILDATWHDGVRPYGFRVNDRWAGTGDTAVAVDVERFLGPAEDPAAAKAAIIGAWPPEVQRRRREFLEEINRWVAAVEERRAA